MVTSIVLVDDHPVVRKGLRAMLEQDLDCTVVGEADDGLKGLEMVEHLKPDVLIVDVMLPGLNGLEVTRRVKQALPQTRIIVLSMHSNEPYVLEALRSGATAYVLKSSSTENLTEAVRAVVTGQRYLSPPLTERAIEAYIQRSGAVPEVSGYQTLTSREREVFQLAAEGLSNAEIGERLFISPRTAETHRSNLMKKLGLRSESELIRYAIQQGIIAGG